MGTAHTRYQHKAIDNAVNVTATVTKGHVEEDQMGHSVHYDAHLTFTYTYEGQSYTSDDIYPGSGQKQFESRSDAEHYVQKMNGTNVTAHVYPKKPGKAFLYSKAGDPLTWIALGGVIAFIGLLAVVGNLLIGLVSFLR
ncbi:MAG: DUF3592 domain-containing protein [Halorientalis sp.]